jgi:hypothetical protein
MSMAKGCCMENIWQMRHFWFMVLTMAKAERLDLLLLFDLRSPSAPAAQQVLAALRTSSNLVSIHQYFKNSNPTTELWSIDECLPGLMSMHCWHGINYIYVWDCIYLYMNINTLTLFNGFFY